MTENSTSESTAHNEPPSANEDVAKPYLELKYPLLEKLEEGLVRWDKDKHIVKKGPKFDNGTVGEKHR